MISHIFIFGFITLLTITMEMTGFQLKTRGFKMTQMNRKRIRFQQKFDVSDSVYWLSAVTLGVAGGVYVVSAANGRWYLLSEDNVKVLKKV